MSGDAGVASTDLLRTHVSRNVMSDAAILLAVLPADQRDLD